MKNKQRNLNKGFKLNKYIVIGDSAVTQAFTSNYIMGFFAALVLTFALNLNPVAQQDSTFLGISLWIIFALIVLGCGVLLGGVWKAAEKRNNWHDDGFTLNCLYNYMGGFFASLVLAGLFNPTLKLKTGWEWAGWLFLFVLFGVVGWNIASVFKKKQETL